MTVSSHPEARGDGSRFAILFNHLTDAVFIHDLEGNFLEVNDTACRRLGYSRDELLRMSPADIDDPASRALIGERVATLRKEGRLLFEAVHCGRSGERIAVEIHSQVIPFDGREVILSVARDIRRRKALEAAMHEAKAGLRALLDALPESALLLDELGKVKALNSVAAARFGLSPEAMLGQDFFGFMPPELAEARRQTFEAALRRDEPVLVHDERAGMRFESRVVPVRQGGQPPQVAIYAADITERTLLEGLESLTHELDQHVLRGKSWDELMQFLCRRIVHVLQLPLAWVGKRHVAEDTLIAVAAAGTAEPCLVKLLQANHAGGLPEVTSSASPAKRAEAMDGHSRRPYPEGASTTAYGTPLGRRKATPEGRNPWMDSAGMDAGRVREQDALGPALAALRSGRPQSANTDDPAWERWASIVEGFRIRAGFAIPLIVRGKVEGVYSLYAERPDQFDNPLIRTRLERLSDHLSLTLEMAMDQQRMRLLNDALVAAGNPTFITDREGTIVWANQAFLNLTGYEMGEVLGHNPRLLQSGRQPADYYQQLWETISAGGAWSCETINRRKDGELYVVQQTITPIRDPQGDISHYISIHEDITAKKINQERIAHLAHHDVLTGLPNRRLLMERLTRAIAMARRSGQGVTLLFLDLDGFKPINDGFGHLAGDRLLQEVARRLQGLCRESDTVARLGGDEFTILLPGSHTDMEAGAVARKVIQAMGQPFPLDGQSVTIGTSIGIALWPEHAQGPEELIAAADRAMYAAKKAGRGVFRFACARDHAPPRS
ncbi:MAG: diguanylate cyclase domain-containing protein [Pseudomonadota bacterium]